MLPISFCRTAPPPPPSSCGPAPPWTGDPPSPKQKVRNSTLFNVFFCTFILEDWCFPFLRRSLMARQAARPAVCLSVLMRGETGARKFAHKKGRRAVSPPTECPQKHTIKERPSSKTFTTRKVHAVICVGDLSFHSLLFGRFPRNKCFC